MRFLTYSECAEWCSHRKFRTRHRKGYSVGPDPDLRSPPFHFVEFTPPSDSGGKVWFSRFLYSLVEPAPEMLIWLGDWSVWPSCQHMPLFTKFRTAFGEQRPLIEAPGHLVTPEDADDALSIIGVSLLFIWDCHILSALGRDAVFTSHNEYGWFASRDAAVTESVEKRIAEAMLETKDPHAA